MLQKTGPMQRRAILVVSSKRTSYPERTNDAASKRNVQLDAKSVTPKSLFDIKYDAWP